MVGCARTSGTDVQASWLEKHQGIAYEIQKLEGFETRHCQRYLDMCKFTLFPERRANLLQQGITEEELEAMEIDSGFVNMKTTEDAYITKMNSKSDGHSIIVTKKKVLKNKNNQTVRLKRKRGEQEGSKPRASRSKHNDDDNSDDNDNEGFVTVKSLRQRTVAALYNTLDSSDESPSERKGSDDEDFEL